MVGSKPGPRLYLKPNEENGLSEYLITSAKVGYGKTHRQNKCIAESVAKKGMLKKESDFKWMVAEISGKKSHNFSS